MSPMTRLNEALPSGEMSPDQIEDIQTALSEMGVQIVENDEEAEAETEEESDGPEALVPDEDEDEEEDDEKKGPAKDARAGNKKLATGERTDDPVADVPARDGRGRTAEPRRRNRHRQADRSRTRHDDHGPVRKPDHLSRHHPLVRSAQQSATCNCARSSISIAMLSKEPPADKMAEGAEDDDDDGEISEAHRRPDHPRG